MDNSTPLIDNTIATQLLTQAQQKAFEVSQGKLTDRSPSSPVTAILEATVVVATTIQQRANEVATEIEDNRIAIFGIERRQGRQAVGTVRIKLNALYNQPFILPKGFRVSFDGAVFQTITDFSIPAFSLEGTTSAIALEPGIKGNVGVNAISSYPTLTQVESISLTEPALGGQDEEFVEQWRQRIRDTVRRRETLLSETDFEDEVKDYLGVGSVSVAIGRLKPDKTSYTNGFVGVFGLNPDGTQLNNAQLSQLQDYLTRKAAMATITMWSIDLFPANLSVIVGVKSGVAPQGTSDEINFKLREYLQPGKLPPGEPILNKALEYIVQGILGVVIGAVSIEINGLAAPLALPNKWTVAQVKNVKVICTTGTGQSVEFNYT